MTSTSYKAEQSSSKGFILIVLAICLLGAGAVAFIATTGAGSNDPDAVDQVATVVSEGELLPQMVSSGGLTTAAVDPAVGMTAPRLVGTDFEGNEVVIEADGRPKIVYFLAHWCSHCQAEAPRIQELIDSGVQPENLDIYAVSTSVDAGRGNYPPLRWLESINWTPVVMRDDAESSALIQYGAGGFPYAVYLDGDHTVLARSAGELNEEAIAQSWLLTASVAP